MLNAAKYVNSILPNMWDPISPHRTVVSSVGFGSAPVRITNDELVLRSGILPPSIIRIGWVIWYLSEEGYPESMCRIPK